MNFASLGSTTPTTAAFAIGLATATGLAATDMERPVAAAAAAEDSPLGAFLSLFPSSNSSSDDSLKCETGFCQRGAGIRHGRPPE